METELPASSLLRLPGVSILREEAVAFDSMLDGFATQQNSRGLDPNTIRGRRWQLERFRRFAGTYPWEWLPGDVEDFTASLTSGSDRLAHSTIRIMHSTIKLFCDYLCDQRYPWVAECLRRFDATPSQVCFEWNTIAHTSEYEGRPGRRPFDYDELQLLFDVADARVSAITASGRKGALAALRDSQVLKTAYAFGLRRREVLGLDLTDVRSNPKVKQWGRYGAVHVRWGKASKGSPPKRRTVLALPEFDWAIEGLQSYVEDSRPLFGQAANAALWPTERGTRVGLRSLDRRFAELRNEAGLAKELTLHCLRHSYVTHLAEFGYPTKFIQDQVGHRHASTTAIYTNVSDDYRNSVVANAVNQLLN
jgi:integrase